MRSLGYRGVGLRDVIGKTVRGDHYLHVSVYGHLAEALHATIAEAIAITGMSPETDFNVIKIRRGGKVVSLLQYPEFFEEPFPALKKSVTVDLLSRSFNTRIYKPERNPPILHKKELLLTLEHPLRGLFQQLTKSLEMRNIKPDKTGMGFKKQWDAYLGKMGVTIRSHQVLGR